MPAAAAESQAGEDRLRQQYGCCHPNGGNLEFRGHGSGNLTEFCVAPNYTLDSDPRPDIDVTELRPVCFRLNYGSEDGFAASETGRSRPATC